MMSYRLYFLCIGITAFIIDALTFTYVMHLVPLIIARIFSFLLANLLSFNLYLFLIYNKKKNSNYAVLYLIFLFSNSISAFLNIGVSLVLIEFYYFNSFIAVAFGTLLGLVYNYFANKSIFLN
jgi:putative flippase GtrA